MALCFISYIVSYHTFYGNISILRGMGDDNGRKMWDVDIHLSSPGSWSLQGLIEQNKEKETKAL
jgi:hypothetical protein